MLNNLPANAVPALAAFAVAAALSGCGPKNTDCDRICGWEADCWGRCDYVEDPECDQEALQKLTLENCLSFCEAPDPLTEDLRSAARLYADCLQQTACDATTTTPGCEVAEMRYNELYLSAPGEWVCGYFCTEIENGCVPWEKFGYRGSDCLEKCKQGARVPECREAHYAYDLCTPGTRYACSVDVGGCQAEETALSAACEGWSQVDSNPGEVAECSQIGSRWCDCNLTMIDQGCLDKAANECRFQLGKGQACTDALSAFDSCMQGIQECSRDALRDTCEPEWSAWVTWCLY